LPKVLQPLAGRPMLEHVIDAARSLDPDHVYVIYGHGGARVQAALHKADVDWVLQAQQLGTGHAVMQAMPLIPDEHTVLVLYGDVPLIKPGTLKKMLAGAAGGSLAVLTAELDNPEGYGRILRDASGRVQTIVEQADATAAQQRIGEINTGVMAARADLLRNWLLEVTADNRQQEFYLTDVVGIASTAGATINTVAASSAAEVAGINDKVQLAQAEAHHRRERAHELLLAGATIVDPERIDIRGDVAVGRDVYIDINVILAGKVRLAAGVKIPRSTPIASSTTRWSARTAESGHSRACGRGPCCTPRFMSATSSKSRTRRSARAPRQTISRISAMPRSDPTSTSARAASPATTTARTNGLRSSMTVHSSAPAA
jgi:bifunctional UDP-N-acetylglucosamine pyrophosphorylase/glucosamine-1-phosphate N-acetyltransferase